MTDKCEHLKFNDDGLKCFSCYRYFCKSCVEYVVYEKTMYVPYCKTCFEGTTPDDIILKADSYSKECPKCKKICRSTDAIPISSSIICCFAMFGKSAPYTLKTKHHCRKCNLDFTKKVKN